MLDDEDVAAILEAVGGCTVEGCDRSTDVWMSIVGREGTPEEGKVAFICEEHTKEMAKPKTLEERQAFADRVRFVLAIGVDLGLN